MNAYWRRGVRSWSLIGLGLVISLVVPSYLVAQDYPSQPINLICGMAPGAAVGISAQAFAEAAGKYLPKPQPILVNFKPGAGTAVAADYLLRQPADGYNLLWFSADTPVKIAKDGANLPFKMDDFIHVGRIAYTPFILPVRKEKSPYKKLEDFIDYAKKHPGEIKYGSSGIGAVTHLAAEIFQEACGIKLNHIPFTGSAESLPAMLGGHIDTMFTTPGTVKGLIMPGGTLRVLAVFAPQRLTYLRDVPTLTEKGYSVEFRSWYTLAARKGMPQPVLKILEEVFKKTAQDPKLHEKLLDLGFVPEYLGAEEATKKAQEFYDAAKQVFKRLGLI